VFSKTLSYLSLQLFKNSTVRDFWAKNYSEFEFNTGPWTPLKKPVKESQVCLITSGGLHLNTELAFDMTDPNGDPTYRSIPLDSNPSNWKITHNYYDHEDAEKDWNLIFPLERLCELTNFKKIGALAPTHFSLMGHITGPHLPTLLHQTARNLADRLRDEYTDLALLVPA
jgi:D-proline reductase (dithiol) PrdB